MPRRLAARPRLILVGPLVRIVRLRRPLDRYTFHDISRAAERRHLLVDRSLADRPRDSGSVFGFSDLQL
jgi:hypothetical protein